MFALVFGVLRYLADYFTPGMEMLRRDANMLHALLKKTSPSVHRHLEKHNVEPFLYVRILLLFSMQIWYFMHIINFMFISNPLDD